MGMKMNIEKEYIDSFWDDYVPLPFCDEGWFEEKSFNIIKKHVDFLNVKSIIELGSWMGKSTRFFLDSFEGMMFCIDTWRGAPEQKAHHAKNLHIAFETFLSNNYKYKDRLIPLRMNTISGLLTLKKLGVSPDLIFIDAAHDYKHVIDDLEYSLKLFPDAIICGHDANYHEVANALKDVCEKNKIQSVTENDIFVILKKS